MSKPILSLDFDGVVHHYRAGTKYSASVVHDGPTPGAEEAIASYLAAGFDVQIFSSRTHQVGGLSAMQQACLEWFPRDITRLLGFPHVKPPALIGLDDRILTFTGEWPSVETLRAFRPWNRK